MAYYNKNSNNSARQSGWNEWELKMIRCHELQHRINFYWANPLLQNPDQQCYNYELIYNHLFSLYMEVKSKCIEQEITETDNIVEVIQEYLDDFPPYEYSEDEDKIGFDDGRWKNLRKLLKRFDARVRKLLDNHGFSPDKDWDEDGL